MDAQTASAHSPTEELRDTPHDPGPRWGKRTPLIAICVVMAVAAILRATPPHAVSILLERNDGYRPLAVALGLIRELPTGGTLAAYVYAFAYGTVHWIVTTLSPTVSMLDFCAGFVNDPGLFSRLARLLTIEAGVLTVWLTYILFARLVDPWAGVATAFIMAVHPAAIALSQSLGSDVFCVVFLLSGLVVFCTVATRPLRRIEFATAGLAFGFASEALPMTWIIIIALFIWLVHITSPAQRKSAVVGASLSFGAFLLAALTVKPGTHIPQRELVLLFTARAVVGIIIMTAMVAALRLLHITVPRSTYAGLVLGPAIIASVMLVSTLDEQVAVPVASPGQATSEWIMRGIPPEATIAVDSRLNECIDIPRTAQSWARELQTPATSRTHTIAYATVAMHAASSRPVPAWDLTWLTPPESDAISLTDTSGREIIPAFIVLPDASEPTLRRIAHTLNRDLWLIVRFRPANGNGRSITVWD